MDKVEALIKKLTDLKEELNKNVNMSYSQQPNVSQGSLSMAEKADIVKPDTGFGATTVKDTKPSPTPADPAHPYGKVIVKDDCSKAEYLQLFKNGQWYLDKK